VCVCVCFFWLRRRALGKARRCDGVRAAVNRASRSGRLTNRGGPQWAAGPPAALRHPTTPMPDFVSPPKPATVPVPVGKVRSPSVTYPVIIAIVFSGPFNRLRSHRLAPFDPSFFCSPSLRTSARASAALLVARCTDQRNKCAPGAPGCARPHRRAHGGAQLGRAALIPAAPACLPLSRCAPDAANKNGLRSGFFQKPQWINTAGLQMSAHQPWAPWAAVSAWGRGFWLDLRARAMLFIFILGSSKTRSKTRSHNARRERTPGL
jgi:hypothetical protein